MQRSKLDCSLTEDRQQLLFRLFYTSLGLMIMAWDDTVDSLEQVSLAELDVNNSFWLENSGSAFFGGVHFHLLQLSGGVDMV